jgi:hypothetical protein
VNRAAKLCQEPAAITIQKQAMAGSRAAKKCFEALKLFREGKCEISSVDWDEYREILTPAPGQNCQAKAAEMVMDWLRWNLGMNRDVAPLKYWIGRIGNLDLASRLMPRDSATAYDEMREQDEKLKSRKKAVVRQRISRVRRRISKLNDNCRALLRLIFSRGAKGTSDNRLRREHRPRTRSGCYSFRVFPRLECQFLAGTSINTSAGAQLFDSPKTTSFSAPKNPCKT